jgi:hypothetical protein
MASSEKGLSEPSSVRQLEKYTEGKPSKSQEDLLRPPGRLQIQVCRVAGQAAQHKPKQPIAFSEGRPVTISRLALDSKLRTAVERMMAEGEWNEIRGKAVRVAGVR